MHDRIHVSTNPGETRLKCTEEGASRGVQMEIIVCYRVCVSVFCFSFWSLRFAATCFFDTFITPRFLYEVHFVTAHLYEQPICNISMSNR